MPFFCAILLPMTFRATASLISSATLLLLLLVCKVRCEPLCGSWFDDVSSRTVLAPIVFEGKPRIAHNWTQRDQVRYNFTFRVDRVFKGLLPKRDSGSGFRKLVVGIFGQLADRTNCVGTNISLEYTYVVFLNSTVVGRSGRLNIYRITSFPEPATKEVIEDVQKYSRAKNVQPPNSKIENGPFVNGTLESRLQLVCRKSGKPIPVVQWTKDDHAVQPRKGLLIRETRRSSKLQISKLKASDQGAYKCIAMNVLGNYTSSESRISVGHKSHSTPCPTNSYCQNNGTCYFMQSLGEHYCHCNEKFEGKRCQLKKVDLGPSDNKDLFEYQIAVPAASVGLVAVLLICIAIFIYLGYRNCLQRQKMKKAGELSENSCRPYAPHYQPNSHKSSQEACRSKTRNPLMEDVGIQTDAFPSPMSLRKLAIVRPDGIPLSSFTSDRPSKCPSNSGIASSLTTSRLKDISATAPDSLVYQRRIHSSEFIPKDVEDKPHRTGVFAVDRSRTELPTEPTEDTVVTEERKRKSDYDNCWFEDQTENHQNNLCDSSFTKQNHSIDEKISKTEEKLNYRAAGAVKIASDLNSE